MPLLVAFTLIQVFKRCDSLGLDVTKAEEFLGYKFPTTQEVVVKLQKNINSTKMAKSELNLNTYKVKNESSCNSCKRR